MMCKTATICINGWFPILIPLFISLAVIIHNWTLAANAHNSLNRNNYHRKKTILFLLSGFIKNKPTEFNNSVENHVTVQEEPEFRDYIFFLVFMQKDKRSV